MNVILIRPPLVKYKKEILLPLNLIVLGSYLKSQNIDVEIVDFDHLAKANGGLSNRFFDNFISYLSKYSSDSIFGITSMGSNYPYAVKMAEVIKQEYPNSTVVFGGPQATLTSGKTLENFKCIDFIVRNEGELTFCELIKQLENKNTNYSNILGLSFRDKDEVIENEPRPLIKDLDSQPLPDYSLVNVEDYFKINPTAKNSLPVHIGTGCPYACSFCSTSIMWQRKFRIKSPQRINQEISLLNKQYGIDKFSLEHDNLFANKKYIKELSSFFRKNNFTWTGSSRLDNLNEETIRTASESGCTGLYLGIETASKRMQKLINKNIDTEKLENMLKLCDKYNISVTTSYIIGFPEENVSDLEATIKKALSGKLNSADTIQLHPLTPLNGTKYIDEKLVFNKKETSESFHITRDGESVLNSYIEKNSKLFSSFYHIEPKTMSYEDISRLAFFYSGFINYYPLTLNAILNKFKYNFLELFSDLSTVKNSSYECLFNCDIKTFCIDNLDMSKDDRSFLQNIMIYEHEKYKPHQKEQKKGVFINPNVSVLKTDQKVFEYINSDGEDFDSKMPLGSHDDELSLLLIRLNNKVQFYKVPNKFAKTISAWKENPPQEFNIASIDKFKKSKIFNKLIEKNIICISR